MAGTFAPAYSQNNPNFPVAGIGPGQWLRLHAIALGTGQGRCQAALSFRNTANDPLGASLQVDLTIGKSAFLDYPAGDGRSEVRQVVEQLSNPSSCFSSIGDHGCYWLALLSLFDDEAQPSLSKRPEITRSHPPESSPFWTRPIRI